MMTILKHAWAAGELPLWNPFYLSGMPLLAAPQSAAIYPGSYLFLALSFADALSLFVWLHSVIAAFFMYLLVHHIAKDRLAALCSAIVFSLNGYFLYHVVFLPQMSAYVWLPFILYCFLKAMDKFDGRFVFLTALALTLQFFAGHPQFSAYTILILLIVAAVMAWKKKARPAQTLKLLAMSGGLFALLAAVLWVPAFEAAALSVRQSGMSYETITQYSLPLKHLLQFLFLPLWNYGGIQTSGDIHILAFYIGWTGLGLALWGAWKERKNIWVQCALGIALLGLLLSLGRYLPFYQWLYNTIAFFKFFRFPAQILYFAAFGFAILAGFGVMALKYKPKWQKAVLVLLTLELMLFGFKSIDTIDSAIYTRPSRTAQLLGGDKSLYRVMMTPESQKVMGHGGSNKLEAWMNFRDALYPNLAAGYGFYEADSNEVFLTKRYARVLSQIHKDPGSPWMKLLNVKYLFSFWPMRHPEYSYLRDIGMVKIMLNRNWRPRAYFVPQVIPSTSEEAFTQITAKSKNPHKTALVEEIGDVLRFDVSDIETSKRRTSPMVSIEQYGISGVRLGVETDRAGMVVLADNYFPGWRAWVNGDRVPIYRTHYLFRGVLVEPGGSVIEMRYLPASFIWGTGLTFAGILMGFFLLVFRRK